MQRTCLGQTDHIVPRHYHGNCLGLNGSGRLIAHRRDLTEQLVVETSLSKGLYRGRRTVRGGVQVQRLCGCDGVYFVVVVDE